MDTVQPTLDPAGATAAAPIPQSAPVVPFAAPTEGRAALRDCARAVVPLVAILALFVPFRLSLAKGDPPLTYAVAPELMAKPWRLLLPFEMQQGANKYRWTPLGYAMVVAMAQVMSLPRVFVVLLAALVIVSYALSWLAFRSWVFSSTLAVCMGFGTQFNYSYVDNGGHLWILYTLYLIVNLYFLHALATRPAEARWPRVGFVLSLIAFALCWEQWLDYLVFLFAGCAFLYLVCRRHADVRGRYAGRIGFVALTALLVAAGYLAVKLPYSGEHFEPGHESDTIFTYPSVVMAVEDFISNLFTYPYMALTNYVPSWFVASNSLYRYGAEGVLREQHGYHVQRAELVRYHHIFYWYYYAGAMFLAFAWCFAGAMKRCWARPSYRSVLVLVFLALILSGFATHSIIKFRPYLSVPLLAYKCMISTVAVALLLGYALDRAARRFRRRGVHLLGVVAVWAVILYGAVDRFPLHNHFSQTAGLGAFPDPTPALRSLVRHPVSFVRHQVSLRARQ